MELATLEAELKKRLQDPYYAWGQKQTNEMDKATNFIYQMPSWERFKYQTQGMTPALYSYAINRWFNFWSAKGVEAIFCSMPGVVAAKDPKDRLVDFSIQGIRFDHKSTVFPKGYDPGEEYAMVNPWHLATWLYQNQSRGQRHHLANRLFIVLSDWKLKAYLSAIYQQVKVYVDNFGPDKLIKLTLYGNQILTDVIWIPGKVTQPVYKQETLL